MGVFVAFDIGNVLCHFDITKFTSKLSYLTGMSEGESLFFLAFMQKMQDLGITTVSDHLEYKFYAHNLQPNFKLSPSNREALLKAWNETLTPSDMMLTFMDKLRGEGVKIALLSNMGHEHIKHLRNSCPQMFEGTVQHISCEVGARKPSKLFFQSFCLDNDEFCRTYDEDGNREDFSGCVYVDDIEENLKVGKKYGFKVYKINLDELVNLPQSKQKMELDKLKTMIFNKM